MGDDLCVAEVQEWADGLAELRSLIGWCFARSEPREHAIAYVRGLLSAEERKNSWTLSERAGNGHSGRDATVVVDHRLGPAPCS